MTENEFSRTVRIDALGTEPKRMEIAATPAEREALARRFRLQSIDRLEATLRVAARGDDVHAEGEMEAEVVQSCVATGEAVPERVAESFELLFRPRPAGRAEEEVELSESELDILFFEGGSVDVGEAVAETLSLALDPYPRASGAEEALKAAGVRSEEEAGPFGALAALRDRMKKQD